MNTREVGEYYETKACEYLADEGLRVIARNFRVKIGEIDIVALDGGMLVFIEVKYRKTKDYGGAWWAISEYKQKKIRRVAQWFMKQSGYPQETFCRFDAVLIDGNDVEHIKNAW